MSGYSAANLDLLTDGAVDFAYSNAPDRTEGATRLHRIAQPSLKPFFYYEQHAAIAPLLSRRAPWDPGPGHIALRTRAAVGLSPNRLSCASHIAGPLGADETIDADLELPGGLDVRLHASMAARSAFAAPLTVVGNRGRLHVDNLVLPHLGHSVSLERDGRSDRFTVGGRETYDHELDAVVQAIESREEPATGPADFVATMRVIDEIRLAAGVARPRVKVAAS